MLCFKLGGPPAGNEVERLVLPTGGGLPRRRLS